MCHRSLCASCAGGPRRTVCALIRCDDCQAAEAGQYDLLHTVTQRLGRVHLQQQTSEVLLHARRESTVGVHRRALAALTQYGIVYHAITLPTSALQVGHWVTWMLLIRDPTLDPSTIQLYVSVLSDWHQTAREVTRLPLSNPCATPFVRSLLRAAARGYKRGHQAKEPFTARQLVRILHSGFDLCTVGGRHDRLLFCFLGFGPLRPGVTVRLIVHYTLIPDACCPLGLRVAFAADSDVKIIKDHIEIFVSEDKNVDARSRRYVPIPAGVLGVDTPGDLEYYLKVCQPPSGGTLFAAPASPLKKINAAQPFTGTFNKNPYTASCAMVRRAFLRAYPESEEDEQKLFGGGSPRKTLAQLLFAIHRCRRMVIDFGGWADGEQQAVDSYFHYTLEQRCRILQNMLDDLVRVAELPAIDAAVCTQA